VRTCSTPQTPHIANGSVKDRCPSRTCDWRGGNFARCMTAAQATPKSNGGAGGWHGVRSLQLSCGSDPGFFNTKVIQMGPRPTVQLSSSTMAEESKPQHAGLR